MTLTPFLGARVPVATQATAVEDVVPVVVAESDETPPVCIF